MSATAVLAKPSRRNSPSAASMMRARVSSGLVLTCTVTAVVLMTDENSNSSASACQEASGGRGVRACVRHKHERTACCSTPSKQVQFGDLHIPIIYNYSVIKDE